MLGANGGANGRLPKPGEINLREIAAQSLDVADLTTHADSLMLKSFVGASEATLPMMARWLAEAEHMAERLAGDRPSEAELILSRTAASNWLWSKLLATAFAIASNSGETQAQTLDCYQRSISRCEKRLSLALRSLSAIRRLDVRLESLRLSIRREKRP
jgi:hypothetical protein